MKKKLQKKQKLLLFAALFLLSGIIILLLTFFSQPAARRNDYQKIFSEQYDTVFLSMYPIDNYRKEDFLDYRGMTVFKASYCMPDCSAIRQYMKLLSRSGNAFSTVYLGIRPDKITLDELQRLVSDYPDKCFEIMLACPSSTYWCNLSAEEYAAMINAYCEFLIDAPPAMPNSHLYFMGSQEWFIANPANYDTEWLASESGAHLISLASDYLHEYYVTPQSASSFAQELVNVTEKIRNDSATYPDLSDYRIIFLGDSIIENCTNSVSITGVVAAFTGAEVCNCGVGGLSAAQNPKFPFTPSEIATALVEEDASALPKDSPIYQKVTSCISGSSSARKVCFVLYYGLNDYFDGLPVSSEADPYDPATYCGGIRLTVKAIRSRYHDAQIILCTPNYIYYLDQGTTPRGEKGYILEDYVNAVLSLSEELGTDVLDLYHIVEINSKNWPKYLTDQIHLNTAYQYIIGQAIIRQIR